MARRVQVHVVPAELPGAGLITVVDTVVVLSDASFETLAAAAFVSGALVDLGAVSTGGAVVNQANFVAQQSALTSAQQGALTSSQNATTAAIDLTTSEALANALKANYNQLQTDVAALRTSYNALQVDMAATLAKVNAELTALQLAGGPQKSS